MIQSSGAPSFRVGQRFLNWGSTLYMFGGVTRIAPTVVQANDLYALDLTSSITTPGTPATWVTVSPPTTPTGPGGAAVVPGYPPPRIGYSWTGYQVGAIMFGGISTDTPNGDPFACVFSPPGTPADPVRKDGGAACGGGEGAALSSAGARRLCSAACSLALSFTNPNPSLRIPGLPLPSERVGLPPGNG